MTAAEDQNSVSQLAFDPADRLINRELSWLSFNERVLEEAENESVPLFERVRFLSISAENLEEFYMVRVAGLKGQTQAGITSCSQDGLSPQEQLLLISTKARTLVERQNRVWNHLRSSMCNADVEVISTEEITADEHLWLEDYFLSNIFPVVTPIAVDSAHPFPFIPNLGMALVLKLKKKKAKTDLYGLVPIPTQLGRFIQISGKTRRFIRIEQILVLFFKELFPGFTISEYGIVRVIRDSDIEIEEEAEDLVELYEIALKRRRRGSVIRLSTNLNMSDELKDFLVGQFNAYNADLESEVLIGLTDTKELIPNNDTEFLFKEYNPRFPERIRDFGGDCFSAIKSKDIIIQHPYESFDVVVLFIRQAAQDPKVFAIKQTLYRTSSDSPIVLALIEAAEAGKSVTVLVELAARFDEEQNIRWARDLERAGAQVVHGFLDLKTHAKVSLVSRREAEGLETYCHFGTGNYDPVTARYYTDLSYFTSNKELCQDAAALFNYITSTAAPRVMSHLSYSPVTLRREITRLIRNEIENANKNKPSGIWLKINSLVDNEIIDLLYQASNAGVNVELIVRGICCLKPRIHGLSENIRVKSIIGRFLEHSRIYCFANGHSLPHRKSKVFISSADLMPRNLDRRIETLVPITNETVHRQILDQIMIANLKDNTQSWVLNEKGVYDRITPKDQPFSAHDYFMTYPSLSGRGTALDFTDLQLPRLKL
ncbi:MAG: RNA degradosome polyphosphate kinase [Alphaproteobacteria bacterium]